MQGKYLEKIAFGSLVVISAILALATVLRL